jgi:hypothetical protein
VSWSQLVLTWIFVPLLSLQGFGGIPMSKIGFVFQNGFQCFIGNKSTPIFNDKMEVIGHCSPSVAITTMIFSTSGFIAGILFLNVTKRQTAVLTTIITAATVPLVNVAFSVRFIMGDETLPFSYMDIIGLVLVVVGFVLYSIFDEKKKTAADEPEQESVDVSIQVGGGGTVVNNNKTSLLA